MDDRRPRQARDASRSGAARERILEHAYTLFSSRGIRGVGIDTVIAESNVAKMTLYRYFPSKDDLVLAVLDRREEVWTRGWLQGETRRRFENPGERLLGVFDLLDEWFQRGDFEGCLFINVLFEITDPDHVIHVAAAEHLANVGAFLRELAEEAGVSDPAAFARQWHVLLNGAIVAAAGGDRQAGRAAKEAGKVLLALERVAHEIGLLGDLPPSWGAGRRSAAS